MFLPCRNKSYWVEVLIVSMEIERNQTDEWFTDIYDDEFEKLEGLATDLMHEIGNPLQVISGHLEIHEEDGTSPLLEGEGLESVGLTKEFVEATERLSDHVGLYRTVPEPVINEIERYASDERFPEGLQSHADRINNITRDVHNYQNRLINDEMSEQATISELLRPLENCADNIAADTDFSYKGSEEETVEADTGMRMAFWTLGKNWENHASQTGDRYEVGFDVEREDNHYEIDVWNTGEGFFEEGLERTDRVQAAARKLHRDESDGHGLGMASEIFDVYDGEIAYSEERIEEYEKGFGVKIRVPSSQYSTPDSS